MPTEDHDKFGQRLSLSKYDTTFLGVVDGMCWHVGVDTNTPSSCDKVKGHCCWVMDFVGLKLPVRKMKSKERVPMR